MSRWVKFLSGGADVRLEELLRDDIVDVFKLYDPLEFNIDVLLLMPLLKLLFKAAVFPFVLLGSADSSAQVNGDKALRIFRIHSLHSSALDA